MILYSENKIVVGIVVVVIVVVVGGGGGRGRFILHFKSSQKFCKVIAITQRNQTNGTVRYFTYEPQTKDSEMASPNFSLEKEV